MFYGEFISITIQGYIEFMLVSLINLQGTPEDPDSNNRNTFYSSTVMGILLTAFPLALLYVVFLPEEKFDKPTF